MTQRFNGGQWRLLIVFILSLSGQTLTAQNGPACSSYTNKATANGLGGNFVFGVYASGTTVYAATSGELAFCTAAVSPLTLALTANVAKAWARVSPATLNSLGAPDFHTRTNVGPFRALPSRMCVEPPLRLSLSWLV